MSFHTGISAWEKEQHNEFILVVQAEIRESNIPISFRDLKNHLNSKVVKLSSFQKPDVGHQGPQFQSSH